MEHEADIVVVGSGLVGLLATWILDSGLPSDKARIVLVGKGNNSPLTTKIGGAYLHRTAEVDHVLERFSLSDRYNKNTSDVLRILWRLDSTRIGVPTEAEMINHLAGYHLKRGDSSLMTPVCRGLSEIEVYESGASDLAYAIQQSLYAAYGNTFLRIDENVRHVVKGEDGRLVISGTGFKINSRRVVNTLPRSMWLRLRGYRDVPYSFVKSAIYSLPESVPHAVNFPIDGLIYSGLSDPWYRASFRDGRWLFESTNLNLGKPWEKVFEYPSRVVRLPEGLGQEDDDDDGVTHLGRWAELREDMLVSDVIHEILSPDWSREVMGVYS